MAPKKHQLTVNTAKEIIKCQPDKEKQSSGQQSNSKRHSGIVVKTQLPRILTANSPQHSKAHACEDLSYLDPSLKMYSQLTSYLATL